MKPSEKTVRELVADRLAGSGEQVKQLVVESLVQKEMARRMDAVVSVLEKLDLAIKEVPKVKMDATFDAKGDKIGEYYTKENIEKRTKLLADVDRYQKAIDKALGGNDFSDVLNLGKNEPKTTT